MDYQLASKREEKRSEPNRRELGEARNDLLWCRALSAFQKRRAERLTSLLSYRSLGKTRFQVSAGHDQVRQLLSAFDLLRLSSPAHPRHLACGQGGWSDQPNAASCPYHQPLAASAISTCPPRPCASSVRPRQRPHRQSPRLHSTALVLLPAIDPFSRQLLSSQAVRRTRDRLEAQRRRC